MSMQPDGAGKSASEGPPGAARWDPIALVFLAAAFLYAALTIDRGWIPHDDGMLGQAAIRVLTGDLPHRDFHDVYTGALSYWHALSFALFGINLLSPRILLLLCFAGFLAAAYGIARRFAAPRPAAAVVLLSSVWSVPNYPTAMPTWYNLFLAVAGLWCVFRYLDSGDLRWLATCGVACGLSVVIKIVGLYTVAAFLMVLALVEAGGNEESSDQAGGASQTTGFSLIVTTGVSAYCLLVLWLVRANPDAVTLIHFVVPSAAIAGVTIWRVRSASRTGGPPARLGGFVRLVAVFSGGVAIPVSLLLVPYVVTGSVGDLITGTLILPFRRLSFAAAAPPRLDLFLPTLVPLALGALAGLGTGAARQVGLWGLGAVLLAAFALGGVDEVYRAAWGGVFLAPVLVTVWVLVASARAWRRGEAGHRPLMAAATGAVLGTFTLVQYPFAGPVYFFYVAPLVALAGLAAVSFAGRPLRVPTGVLLVFMLAFGVRWVGTASLYATAGGYYVPRPVEERLDLERGRIRVSPDEKIEYERLATMLSELSAGNRVTFVTPDAPEAYFLSSLRNPTPIFYDFLDEPEGRTERIIATLEREDVRVIALNRAPQFSGPPPADLVAAIERRYPQAAEVGRFIVRWR